MKNDKDLKQKTSQSHWIQAILRYFLQKHHQKDFQGGPVVKNPPSNAGDTGSVLRWGT